MPAIERKKEKKKRERERERERGVGGGGGTGVARRGRRDKKGKEKSTATRIPRGQHTVFTHWTEELATRSLVRTTHHVTVNAPRPRGVPETELLNPSATRLCKMRRTIDYSRNCV